LKRRLPHPLRRFRLPAALLAVVIVYGMLGYMLIEGWGLLDSFYMTIITISTVGYSEVNKLSDAGRIFTSTLIVVGVGTMLYGFASSPRFSPTTASSTTGESGSWSVR
jgi:voltage-gated potassium channel